MLTVHNIPHLRDTLCHWRVAGQRLAFVPTMGNLHAGHLQLVRTARNHADRVIVSVFVNPLQFGPNEDYQNYPRSLVRDQQLLADLNIDLLFVPDVVALYPQNTSAVTQVSVLELNNILCGEFRPGHFDGVTTVVAKLFNLVQPDVAIFGKKDYQQLLLIRRMVVDLNYPIDIIGVNTVREADGLALSSRNQYLSVEQRAVAPLLYQTLGEIGAALRAGATQYSELTAAAINQLLQAGFKPDYLTIRQPDTLQPATTTDASWVVLAAAYLGKARLIDNLEINAE